MLEQKIEELSTKLDATIAALEALTVAVYTQPVKVDPEEELPVVGKKQAEAPKAEEPKIETLTHDDLLEVCTAIVRSDRSKKQTVKDTIAEFGGAKVLKDVPETDLPALKAKLEAL